MLIPDTRVSTYSVRPRHLPRHRTQRSKGGAGILNSIIDKLGANGIELHYPGYNYLGPGTRLEERLRNNSVPINPLDEAAREHDISYSKFSDLPNRHIADRILENKSWKRVLSKDASLGERAAAWLTTNAMKIKRKLGMGGSVRRKKCSGKGIKRKRSSVKCRRRRGSGLTFRQLVARGKRAIKGHKPSDIHGAVKKTLVAIKKHKLKSKVPRIIPVPKSGGAIPIVPILSALFRYGPAVYEGISTIVTGVKKLKQVRDDFKSNKIGSGQSVHIGNGISFGVYKKGYGLYLA